MSRARSREWCFTLFCELDSPESVIWPLGTDRQPPIDWSSAPNFKYMHYQVEQCPTGDRRVHLQGFMCFSSPTAISALKKIHASAHWEASKGSISQNLDYCSKSETRICGPFHFGDCPRQGKRSDLTDLLHAVQANKTNEEILLETEGTAARYSKQIVFMRFTLGEKFSDRQLTGVRNIVLYGPTDVGKTYAAVNLLAGGVDYFIAECPSHANSKLWFDGYEGQKTLILDDFTGDFCAFRFLLRLLDAYKLRAEIKGGFVWAQWSTVIITSNYSPNAWFTTPLDQTPLKRRLTNVATGSEIRHCESRGTYTVVDWDCRPLGDDGVALPHVSLRPPPVAPVAPAAAPVGQDQLPCIPPDARHVPVPDDVVPGSPTSDDEANAEWDRLLAANEQRLMLPPATKK